MGPRKVASAGGEPLQPRPVRSVNPVLLWRHDVFNLVSLPLLVGLNLVYFLGCSELRWPGYLPAVRNISLDSTTCTTYAQSWDFWAFNIYLLVDTAWLVIFPSSVPSAAPLIYHHIGTILGWYSPLFDQRWAFWSSLAALVEFNTWILILKRQYGKDVWLVHFAFYVSWVVLRLLVYPIGLVVFAQEYWAALAELPFSPFSPSSLSSLLSSFISSSAAGSASAAAAAAAASALGTAVSGGVMLLLIAFLNLLNGWWTWDLLTKHFRPQKKDNK